MLTRLILSLGLLAASQVICCSAAYADWIIAGAQYSCDRSTHTFQLLPFDTSSGDPPEGIQPTTGFKQVDPIRPSVDGRKIEPKKSQIICRLGWHTLHATIIIYPPSEAMCGAGGKVTVLSLSATGVDLSPANDLNWQCDPRMLAQTSIRVHDDVHSIMLERCYGFNTVDTSEVDHCDRSTVMMRDDGAKN